MHLNLLTAFNDFDANFNSSKHAKWGSLAKDIHLSRWRSFNTNDRVKCIWHCLKNGRKTLEAQWSAACYQSWYETAPKMPNSFKIEESSLLFWLWTKQAFTFFRASRHQLIAICTKYLETAWSRVMWFKLFYKYIKIFWKDYQNLCFCWNVLVTFLKNSFSTVQSSILLHFHYSFGSVAGHSRRLLGLSWWHKEIDTAILTL